MALLTLWREFMSFPRRILLFYTPATLPLRAEAYAAKTSLRLCKPASASITRTFTPTTDSTKYFAWLVDYSGISPLEEGVILRETSGELH